MTQSGPDGVTTRCPRLRLVLAVNLMLVLVVGIAAACVAFSSSGGRVLPLIQHAEPHVRSDPSVEAAALTREENRRPGHRWQIDRPAPTGTLAGWADHVSVEAGQPVELSVTSRYRSWTATAFRIGWYGGAGARRVWASEPQPGMVQDAPALVGGVRSAAGWRPSLAVDTGGWLPGDYLIRLDASGGSSFVPLTVRSPTAVGRVVVLNAVTTWQAYNRFGGSSLYAGPDGSYASRATTVSFDRPYDYGDGAADFVGNERPLVVLAERLGLPLAYATSVDLAADPGLLRGARGVVSLGHDEYWSVAMRARLTAARDAGTDVAFLGANAVYRRIRLAASVTGPDRLEVNYKNGAADPVSRTDPVQTTADWPAPPDPRPQGTLTGASYVCNPVSADMRFTGAAGWLLAGSGLRSGSVLHRQVGSEYDALVAPHPRPIDVVAHSPLTCRGTPGVADMTWYTVPSGAGVLNTGTSSWVCALEGQCEPGAGGPDSRRAVTVVTTNVLRAFAAGRAGAAHPARGDAR